MEEEEGTKETLDTQQEVILKENPSECRSGKRRLPSDLKEKLKCLYHPPSASISLLVLVINFRFSLGFLNVYIYLLCRFFIYFPGNFWHIFAKNKIGIQLNTYFFHFFWGLVKG